MKHYLPLFTSDLVEILGTELTKNPDEVDCDVCKDLMK